MIRHRFSVPRVSIALSVAVGLAVVGGGGWVVAHALSGPSGPAPMNQGLYAALAAPPINRGIPEVIASSGHRQLTREMVAQQLAVAHLTDHERGRVRSDRDIELSIIAGWVRQVSLLTQAERENIVVSRDEVESWIHQQAQVRAETLAKNPQAAAAFAALLKQRGLVSAEQYDADPTTFIEVEDALRVSALINKHLGPNPTAEKRKAFIAVSEGSAHVAIYWQP